LHVLSPVETDRLNGFLAELKDETVYKKRLADLEALKAQVNKSIEVYGDARKMTALVAEADGKRAEAQNLMDQAIAAKKAAEEKASLILEEARSAADATRNDASAKFAEREQAVRDAEARLGEKEKALLKREDEVETKAAMATLDLNSAKQIRETYTEATKRLASAIDEISRTL